VGPLVHGLVATSCGPSCVDCSGAWVSRLCCQCVGPGGPQGKALSCRQPQLATGLVHTRQHRGCVGSHEPPSASNAPVYTTGGTQQRWALIHAPCQSVPVLWKAGCVCGVSELWLVGRTLVLGGAASDSSCKGCCLARSENTVVQLRQQQHTSVLDAARQLTAGHQCMVVGWACCQHHACSLTYASTEPWCQAAGWLDRVSEGGEVVVWGVGSPW
jgi:hypothetical protein